MTAALAVLQPKPAGYVEVERWTWEPTPGAMPQVAIMSDGSIALRFGPGTIPPDYFVLDVARLDREAAEHKAALSVPGITPKSEKRGHFRS